MVCLNVINILFSCYCQSALFCGLSKNYDISPGGGGGVLGIYIGGVCPGTPKKGGLRCGHSPKRGVLGAGTVPKKGGLRCGHNQKKGEFRTDLVRSCSKWVLGAYLCIIFTFT